VARIAGPWLLLDVPVPVRVRMAVRGGRGRDKEEPREPYPGGGHAREILAVSRSVRAPHSVGPGEAVYAKERNQ
jgi:hypothetical protein